MDSSDGQRREERLEYRWPIWFGADLTEASFSGLMKDVSSGGVAFTCTAADRQLQNGERLMVRFSLPRFDSDDPLATVGVVRTGMVRCVTPIESGGYRIGRQFDTPLSLRPAEEASLAALCQEG